MREREKFPSKGPASEVPSLLPREIRDQFQRILDSPKFEAAERQRDFLRFVVEETLAGNADSIKGFTVATQVFGRKEDFDQATDPIVSIQANKLRRALEMYYLVAGMEDPVRIDIKKGTYVPTFRKNTSKASGRAAPGDEAPPMRRRSSWPTVLIRTFLNLNDDRELNYLTVGLATELAMEITRYQDIRVLMQTSGEPHETSPGEDAHFAIEGSIRKDRSGIKLIIHLVDRLSKNNLWSDTYRADLEAARMIDFQEETARIVAATICSEQGIICKALSVESRNTAPSELQTYEAILRFYEFNANLQPEKYFRTLEILRHAVEIEPECGQVWSMLARLHALNCSLEFSNMETPLEEALSFAEKGAHLNPANQHARLALAYVLLFANDLSRGLAEIERALSLNPESLIFLDSISYLLTLMGEWERGPALIGKVIKLNPYYNNVVHYALWVNWTRQEKYEEALRETRNLNRPTLFWQPMVRAASFGLLGRVEEGKKAAADLLKLKPDFPARGRILIRHYIKFDDIVDRTIQGLRSVGVDVE
jgi:TolB-like protein